MSESRAPRPPTVVIADRDPLASSVLRRILQEAGFVVIAEARSARDAVDLCRHYGPDVLITDMVLPDGDAIEVVARLRADHEQAVATVVVTSQHDDETALNALRAGSDGWLRKANDLDDLPRAIRGVLRGEAALSRDLVRILVDEVRDFPAETLGTRPVHSPLTARQWEVLDLMCAGADDERIARDLEVSPSTVRAHVRAIQRRIGTADRAATVAMAPRLRAGAVSAAPEQAGGTG